MEDQKPPDSQVERTTRETLPVSFDTIPDALKIVPHWVCWKWEQDAQGDLKKPPFNARSGMRASHSDPLSWSSFADGQAAYETGRYAGVGLVLTPNLGLVVIDIDHCIDAEGTIDPKAQAVIAFLETFGEFSPSGTGIHLFVSGKIPGSGRKRGSYEMYEDKRYITITGHHIEGTASVIADSQERLDSLYYRIFEQRPTHVQQQRSDRAKPQPEARPHLSHALEAQAERIIAYGIKTNDNFRRHFRGDPTLWGSAGKYRSKSEADWQLCLLLAYRTYARKDEIETRITLIDTIVRKSGLFDAKWDAPRGSSTYGRQTIVKAIAENDKSIAAKQKKEP